MHQVLCEKCAQITTNGSGCSLGSVGCAHHGPHDLPCVFGALNDEGDRWRPTDELYETVIERLAKMLGIVLRCQTGIDREHAQLGNPEALALEAAKNFANEATFYGVGLAKYECLIHEF